MTTEREEQDRKTDLYLLLLGVTNALTGGVTLRISNLGWVRDLGTFWFMVVTGASVMGLLFIFKIGYRESNRGRAPVASTNSPMQQTGPMQVPTNDPYAQGPDVTVVRNR